jgi:hypothetical protein
VWIETRTIEPPHNVTISGRFGASVMFVAYSRLLRQWYWLQPNGIEEKIAEPPLVYIDADYVAKHTLAKPRARRDTPQHIHRKRSAQLLFDL